MAKCYLGGIEAGLSGQILDGSLRAGWAVCWISWAFIPYLLLASVRAMVASAAAAATWSVAWEHRAGSSSSSSATACSSGFATPPSSDAFSPLSLARHQAPAPAPAAFCGLRRLSAPAWDGSWNSERRHPRWADQRDGAARFPPRAALVSEDKTKASSVPKDGVENLVIIGSGPAGYTAAIYAARANLKPVVFEGYQAGGVPGGQLMTTTEVENFPGFPDGITGPDLMDRMRRQAERWGAELRTEDVEFVDVKNRPFTVRSTECEVKCHSIIIATGATARKLGLPREHEFWSRGISACAICDGASPIFKGQELAVVGGGDTATEEALYLTKYARHVHLLVRREKLRASKAMQDRVLSNPNVTVHFNTETLDVVSNDQGQMSGLKVKDTSTGQEKVLEVRGLFYGIGHKPNSQLLEGQVELDEAGYVLVKNGGPETSVEGVFAAGDLQDHEWRQAITAAGSGCMAALSVERYLTSNNLLVEFHQPKTEEVSKKEPTVQDIQMGFDITLTKHRGQYALRKLYHESPRLVGVLYTSPTCGPCRTLKPILNKVIDEYAKDLHFVEIDIEEDPEIAEAGGIMGTPVVQFFKNKQKIKEISGVKMKREYREVIESNL